MIGGAMISFRLPGQRSLSRHDRWLRPWLCLLVVVLVMLATWKPLAAQSPPDPDTVLSELQRSEKLADEAMLFFRSAPRNEQGAVLDEREAAMKYHDLLEAIEIYLRVAPSAEVEDYRRTIESVWGGKGDGPGGIPRDYGVDKRSFELDLAISILSKTEVTADRLRAAFKLKPIVDNPKLYGAVTTPSNVTELLRNLKWALDHDALLREDFYTPQNFRRFFGVTAVVPERYLDSKYFYSIHATGRLGLSGSLDEPATVKQGGGKRPCLIILERLDIDNSAGHSADATLSCNSTNSELPLTFKDIRALVGASVPVQIFHFVPGSALPTTSGPTHDIREWAEFDLSANNRPGEPKIGRHIRVLFTDIGVPRINFLERD